MPFLPFGQFSVFNDSLLNGLEKLEAWDPPVTKLFRTPLQGLSVTGQRFKIILSRVSLSQGSACSKNQFEPRW